MSAGSNFGFPGSIVRIDPAEVCNVPLPGFASRGADIDRNGVVWISLGSGHLGAFDRSPCADRSTAPRRQAATAPKAGRSDGLIIGHHVERYRQSRKARGSSSCAFATRIASHSRFSILSMIASLGTIGDIRVKRHLVNTLIDHRPRYVRVRTGVLVHSGSLHNAFDGTVTVSQLIAS